MKDYLVLMPYNNIHVEQMFTIHCDKVSLKPSFLGKWLYDFSGDLGVFSLLTGDHFEGMLLSRTHIKYMFITLSFHPLCVDTVRIKMRKYGEREEGKDN